MDEISNLEEHGWQALSQPDPAGREFYKCVLREDAIMLFPRGMAIYGKDQILDSIGGVPWDQVEMSDQRVLDLSQDVRLLV